MRGHWLEGLGLEGLGPGDSGLGNWRPRSIRFRCRRLRSRLLGVHGLRGLRLSCLGLLAWLAPACQSSSGPSQGVLIIAGGAVDIDGPVWPRFLEEVDAVRKRQGSDEAHIAVLPTASGVPERSIAYYPGTLARQGTHVTATVEKVHGNWPTNENNPDVANRIGESQGVWFTGGDQSRITALLRPAPQAGPSPFTPPMVTSTLETLLAQGGVIGGTSAGAAMMSATMLAGGRPENAVRFGVSEEGIEIAPGMGFLPIGIVDQHFLARGRLGRLLVAMQAADEELGFGIDENAAMLVRLGEPIRIEAIGPHAICLVDTRGYDNQPGSWRGRLHLLGNGDRWDSGSRDAVPRPDRVAVPRTPGAGSQFDSSPSEEGSGPASPKPSPWDEDAILHALIDLSRNPGQPQELRSEHTTLTFRADERTRFATTPFHGRDIFASHVIVHMRRR